MARKRYKRWPGLTTAAKQLGCSYQHLYAVVSGNRVSVRLSRRFAEWQAAQGTATTEAQAE